MKIEWYLVQVYGDVEPVLHGPFKTQEKRDAEARRIRATDDSSMCDGLYPLDVTNGKPTINSYSGAFFDSLAVRK